MLGILRFLKENLLWHNFKDYWSVGTKIHKIWMKETICTKNLWKKFFSFYWVKAIIRGVNSLAYIIHIRKSFPVFAITAITKISNQLNDCELQR